MLELSYRSAEFFIKIHISLFFSFYSHRAGERSGRCLDCSIGGLSDIKLHLRLLHWVRARLLDHGTGQVTLSEESH